jgi:hypothetical protein
MLSPNFASVLGAEPGFTASGLGKGFALAARARSRGERVYHRSPVPITAAGRSPGLLDACSFASLNSLHSESVGIEVEDLWKPNPVGRNRVSAQPYPTYAMPWCRTRGMIDNLFLIVPRPCVTARLHFFQEGVSGQPWAVRPKWRTRYTP